MSLQIPLCSVMGSSISKPRGNMASLSRLIIHLNRIIPGWPALVVIMALFSARAWAEGTVTTCDEASLRAALAGGGAVTFACDGTIVLTNTITIATNTVLDASGRSVVISGNHVVRVFSVNGGMNFTLRNLTVADGFVGTGRGFANGAGLLSAGNTRLIDCTFTNNRVIGTPGFGGAIYQGPGTLESVGCSFIQHWPGTPLRIAGAGPWGIFWAGESSQLTGQQPCGIASWPTAFPAAIVMAQRLRTAVTTFHPIQAVTFQLREA